MEVTGLQYITKKTLDVWFMPMPPRVGEYVTIHETGRCKVIRVEYHDTDAGVIAHVYVEPPLDYKLVEPDPQNPAKKE